MIIRFVLKVKAKSKNVIIPPNLPIIFFSVFELENKILKIKTFFLRKTLIIKKLPLLETKIIGRNVRTLLVCINQSRFNKIIDYVWRLWGQV